jgi:SagB-type dehydrogenase family enzyme
MFREMFPIAWAFNRNTSNSPDQVGSPTPIEPVAPFKEYATAQLVPLPAPGKLKGSLGAAIRARLSCRQFEDHPLPLRTLSTLLHASYGIQGQVLLDEHEMLTRPVPSGGGLYPLEVYLLVREVKGLEPGTYHYAVLDHTLERLELAPVPASRLMEIFMDQAYAADAALVVILTAILARSMVKYADRGYRLILLEAGHTIQNLNLATTSLGWGSVNLAGFWDAELGAVLDLDREVEVPVYATAVGKPRQVSADVLRRA